jgi:hypothetical protein
MFPPKARRAISKGLAVCPAPNGVVAGFLRSFRLNLDVPAWMGWLGVDGENQWYIINTNVS